MTIIAGIISRNGVPLPPQVRERLVTSLSRDPADAVERFEGEHWLLAKVDIGAFGVRASVAAPDGAALIVAGEPLLTRGDETTGPDRTHETNRLFASLRAGDDSTLRDAMGVFCAAFYSPQTDTLMLAADKLAIRPLYYAITPDSVAFSSALRVLEEIGACAGGIDLRGTYEMAAFGYPLANRTCYSGVLTVDPAEVVRVTGAAVTRSRYHRWDTLQDPGLSDAALLRELASTFDVAIRNRLRGNKVTLSFLSGGLDSRTIVAALRNQGVTVFTVNFAPPDTKDRVFAEFAARALGTVHHQLDVPVNPDMSIARSMALHKWLNSPDKPVPEPDRPDCIWSGDGGSVGLGHVYMSDEAVRAFDRGDVDGGIRAFLRYNRIAGPANSAMTRALKQQTEDWLIDGIRSEIAALGRKPDGRALHLFLMFNDQRRHLAGIFENIDIRRIEFHLPFFDGRFLEVVLRASVAPFMRHSLYNRWLAARSPVAASVPWQAYPNHEPCPVPYEGNLRDQWGDFWGRRIERRIARQKGARAAHYLVARPFPSHLISRARFAAAVLLSLLGVTSYEHVVWVGEVFTKHYQQSQATELPRIE